MKKVMHLSLAVVVLTLALVGCKDDDDDTLPESSVTFNFNASAGGESLVLAKPYADFLGRQSQVELLKFYISNVKLINAENSEIYVKDVALIDFTENELSFSAIVDPGIYSAVRFGIGLDAAQNASDPSTFKDTHPLATRQNTYWDWAAKYRFLMIDGKTDINDDGSLNQLYSYHTGLDTMYRTTTIMHSITVKSGSSTTLNFEIDVDDIFSKLDTVNCAFDSASTWHGETSSAEIGMRLMDNFTASLTIK